MTEHDSVIPAGGSGKLVGRIKTTATQQGSLSKSISVTTDAKGMERVTLSMTFTAVPAVSVLPRPRVFLSGIHGDEMATTLVVHRSDGEPLEITPVPTGDRRLTVTARTVKEATEIGGQSAAAGDVVVVAAVDPSMSPGSANGRFRLRTNHPEVPNIEIPFNIRVRPVIEVRPSQIRLVLEEGNSSGRTTLFRIQSNRTGVFRLTGFAPSSPELFRAERVGDDVAQQVHTVAVRLADGVEPGSIDGRRMETLVVSTDDAAGPEITVPVMIQSRPSRAPRPLP